MEQHPVPQNVTTFQFRLIGDMTLKQFGYLCGGAILAFVAYKLPLPLIITWPLAGLFAFLGVGFAFIPVEERPMDVWVFSFFRSIYSPTQYIWSNTPQQPAQIAPPKPTPKVIPTPVPTPPNTPTKTVLSGLFQHQQAPPPAQTQPVPHIVSVAPTRSFADNVSSLLHTSPQTPVSSPIPTPAPAPNPPAQPEDPALHQKISSLEETVHALQEQLQKKTVTEDRVLELQKQLTEVMRQKSVSDHELVDLKRTITHPEPEPMKDTQHGSVNIISSQEAAVKVGLPRLTNSPNVITGIVKDDAGNFLPGILVTVTNNESVPVRALKTNKLGQFAASTPLTNGVYFIEIEDPRSRFTFSRVQLTLTGSVVPVIEIIAKSEKTLTREKLTQELFGGHS